MCCLFPPALYRQGAEGSANLQRFAEAWKPVSKEQAAREEMRGFGYPMHPTLGVPPAPVREPRAQ